MTILVLLTGLWLQPHGLAPVLVSGALILAVVWVIAGRWDILSVLLSLLALLLMGGLLSGWAGKLIHDQPAWLSQPVWFLSYYLAGLAVTLCAVLIASALRGVQRLGQLEEAEAHPRVSVFLRFGLALILLASLAYTIVWMTIWDQTSDGAGGILYAMQSGIVGVTAGAVMGIKARRWFRSSGFLFALLVPLLMFGAFTYGWAVSYHDLTEQRAARIEAALERFYARNGRFPVELQELVPRDLLWIPSQVILQEEDWCYQGGLDFYRLGAYWRKYFSTPLELKIYTSAGIPPETGWVCQDRLAEKKQKYDIPGYFELQQP